MPTLNSIPAQQDELVRALVTTGTSEWWYNNRIGDATLHGSISGDYTIVDDPTPGESDTDVALEIGTLRWFGAGESDNSDQFLIRRNDPAPPTERGFNYWLTQGRTTGDDRVRLGQTPLVVGDPALTYSVFFQFTDTGDVIELELQDVLDGSIGSGHHFMNLRIPSGFHDDFDAVTASQDINLVIARRTSLIFGDLAPVGLAVAVPSANLKSTQLDLAPVGLAVAVPSANLKSTQLDLAPVGLAVAVPSVDLAQETLVRANAGLEQTVVAGARVVLDGSSSTSTTPITGYAWQQVTGERVQLIEPQMERAYFTAPEFAEDTRLSFRLRVYSGDESGVSFVTVTVAGVTPFDQRPIAQQLAEIDHLALLLEQYSESPNLHAFIAGVIAIGQTNIISVLEKLQRGLNPDVSQGILLDWIGQRLNLERPYVTAADAEFFGFAGTQAAGGRTWGKAPFFTLRASIEQVEPIGDATYRKLLKARARRLRGGANRETIEAVLAILFGNGYLDESDPDDLTLRVEVAQADVVLYGLVSGRLQEAVLPRHAGRTLSMAQVT